MLWSVVLTSDICESVCSAVNIMNSLWSVLYGKQNITIQLFLSWKTVHEQTVSRLVYLPDISYIYCSAAPSSVITWNGALREILRTCLPGRHHQMPSNLSTYCVELQRWMEYQLEGKGSGRLSGKNWAVGLRNGRIPWISVYCSI
jgi:hypothetical protein